LDKGKVGATSGLTYPANQEQNSPTPRTVSSYLTSDTTATSIVFALYTSAHSEPDQPKPHAATIAALAENGITIRDGIFASDDTYSPTTANPDKTSACPSAPPNTAASTPNSSTAAAASNPPTESSSQRQPKKQTTPPPSRRA
jgi:hypothetical protein